MSALPKKTRKQTETRVYWGDRYWQRLCKGSVSSLRRGLVGHWPPWGNTANRPSGRRAPNLCRSLNINCWVIWRDLRDNYAKELVEACRGAFPAGHGANPKTWSGVACRGEAPDDSAVQGRSRRRQGPYAVNLLCSRFDDGLLISSDNIERAPLLPLML
jgi:hypothetical protein